MMEGDWRKDLERAMRDGEWLERVAAHLKIEDLPFKVMAHGPYLEWAEWKIELQALEDHVKKVTRILGMAPTHTKARATYGAVVTVTWRVQLPEDLHLGLPEDQYGRAYESVTIKVEGWQMEGCRLVHKGEHVETRQTHDLHTECVQVVQNWEDLDPAECAVS